MSSSNDTSAILLVSWAEGLLRRTPYPVLRNVSCELREGRLILRGRLPSYFLKQMAQATLAHVAGSHRIVNAIEVPPREPAGRARESSVSLGAE